MTASPDPIPGFADVDFATDISTVDMSTISGAYDPGEEFAGWVLQFGVTVVPEPSKAGLLGLGAICLFSRRRR